MLDLWDKYTSDNVQNYYVDISKFIWYNCLGLGCKKILDVGCNIGMELVSFPDYAYLCGIDINDQSLAIARDKHPNFVFLSGNVTNMHIMDDLTFDIVFDRGVLIHLSDSDVDKAMSEMLRVSKKYVMNIEYHGEDGKKIDWRGGEPLYYRNMKERWKSYNVDIISDIEIPYEIDNNRVHYTLVRKHGR